MSRYATIMGGMTPQYHNNPNQNPSKLVCVCVCSWEAAGKIYMEFHKTIQRSLEK